MPLPAKPVVSFDALKELEAIPTTSILESTPVSDDISPAVLSFAEKLSCVSSLKDFLLLFSASVPKKLFSGEMILFYESRQLGLRRLFARKGQVHEKMVQRAWPELHETGYGDHQTRLYLARETGRPFSKVLNLPFPEIKDSMEDSFRPPVLFVELLSPGKVEFHLKDFFLARKEIAALVLKRLLKDTSLSRASTLWAYVFGGWREPLAILKKSQVIRSNNAFKVLFAKAPHLNSLRKGLLQLKNNTYHLHYYPVSENKNATTGVLYCQDMTAYFDLRRRLLESEKMTALAHLGRNIAEELTSPLNHISSLIQTLKDSHQNLSFKEEFQEIRKASLRCQKIIKSLLSFSRSGKGFCEILDLNLVLKDTLPLLKTLLTHLKLTLKTASDPLLVRGDFSLLQQAVFNIILNGCQALQGQKMPEMLIESGFCKDGMVFLSFRDNGPGIPQEDIERIFQPLWTSKKQGEGTGLGLSMAQKAVQSFSGRICVLSSPEKGACFKILLPAVQTLTQTVG